jgi:hypothetical protein
MGENWPDIDRVSGKRGKCEKGIWEVRSKWTRWEMQVYRMDNVKTDIKKGKFQKLGLD